MIVTHNLTIDLVEKQAPCIVDAVQGDSARCLELELLENGKPWQIPQDVSAVIRYAKPDGTGGAYDSLPDGQRAVGISENRLTVALAPQLLSVSGAVSMQIALIKEGLQISTFTVIFRVLSEVTGEEESGDYTNLSAWLVEKSQEGSSLRAGSGKDSVRCGEGSEAHSEGSFACGRDDVAGLRGYYFNQIHLPTNTIWLSTSQDEVVAPTNFTWKKGDVVSFTNGKPYDDCSTITNIMDYRESPDPVKNKRTILIFVDELPFTEIQQFPESDKDFGDYTVCVHAKPTEGEVDIGKYAIAVGDENKANCRNGVALGRNNVVTGQYGFASGRDHVVTGYAAKATGEDNVASGWWSDAGGYKTKATGKRSFTRGSSTEASGDHSSAFGEGTKALGYAQTVVGTYNEVDNAPLFAVGVGTQDANGMITRKTAFSVRPAGHICAHNNVIYDVLPAPWNETSAVNLEQLKNALIGPAMQAGEEYATNERHKGKVVYAKYVDLGKLPASGQKTVNYAGSNSATWWSYEAFRLTPNGLSKMPTVTSTGSIANTVVATGYSIIVTAIADNSTYTGFAIVKYTRD